MNRANKTAQNALDFSGLICDAKFSCHVHVRWKLHVLVVNRRQRRQQHHHHHHHHRHGCRWSLNWSCMRVFTVHLHTDTLTHNSPRFHRQRTVSILWESRKIKRKKKKTSKNVFLRKATTKSLCSMCIFTVVNMCARTANDSAHSVISLCVKKISGIG